MEDALRPPTALTFHSSALSAFIRHTTLAYHIEKSTFWVRTETYKCIGLHYAQ